MAGDNLNYEVFIDLSTRGAVQSEQQIKDWTAALDKATKSGEITAKQAEQVSRQIINAARGFRTAAKDVNEYGDSFAPLVKKLAEFRKAYKENVQKTLADKAGFNLPAQGTDVSKMSMSELQSIVDVSDAMNADLVSAARERIKAADDTGKAIERAEKRAQGAIQNTLKSEYDAATARKNRAEDSLKGQWDSAFKSQVGETNANIAAEERMTRAVRTRTKAEQDLNRERRQRDRNAATAAWEAEARAIENSTNKLNEYHALLESQRYANYDIARTLFTVAAGIGAAGTASVVAFAGWEQGMAGVERTTGLSGTALEELEGNLRGLTDVLPISTDEILQMATRAGQLGVAADDIDEFTATMSKLIAVSDTLQADTGSESLARIANLVGTDDYEGLANAIALVGVNSAATDAQIVKTAQEIAQAGAAANFTGDDIIGLSAAFASLGVPPERARSVIQDLISVMNNGLAGANKSLETTGKLFGVTEAEAARLWQTDPAAFIQRMASALGNVDNLTVALSEIGLEGKRAQPVFAALTKDFLNSANGASVLNTALLDAEEGMSKQAELNRQFGIVLGTLMSQWQLFVNSIVTLGASIGEAIAPAVTGFLQTLTEAFQQLRDFFASDVGQMVAETGIRLAAIIAVIAFIRGAIALATATTIAFRVAMSGAAGAGILTSLRNLAVMLGIVSTQGDKARFSVSGLRTALVGLGRATIVFGLLQLAAEALFNFGGAVKTVQQPVHFLIDLFFALRDTIVSAAQTISQFAGKLPGGGIFADWSRELSNYQTDLRAISDQVHGEWDNFVRDNQKAEESVDEFNGQGQQGVGIWNEYVEGVDDAAESTDGLGGSAADAAREVRTLVDYANDLSTVWNRAFDIRFAGQSTLDAFRDTWLTIGDAIAASQANVTKLKAEIQGLNSDISLQQYFLGIAENYGDTKRAEAIRANLAKLQGELADKTADLAKEESSQNKTLTGNTKAAIDNRNQIRSLVQQYQTHIAALAASGMSTDQLQAATASLRQDFINQASQLGYNIVELQEYVSAFDDVATAIANVPTNITVAFNTNPALQALAELEARAAQSANSIGNSLGNALSGAGGGIGTGLQDRTDYAMALAKAAALSIQATVASLNGDMWGSLSYNLQAATQRSLAQALRSRGGFAEGGYTGAGGKYDVAGVVHRGEYVVPKKYVNQSTGLPYADALGRLSRGARSNSYAAGGYARGGMGMTSEVALTAGTIQAIAHAVQPYLVLDGKMVGQSASNQYADETARGAF